MITNELSVETVNLSKIYKLYSLPIYRFLDIFGLLQTDQGTYTQHQALANVNLRIYRGEKVAFIGRNGAGKSTFLKLVTGTIRPTSGTINVYGKSTALLQIGTGFHPEFTGRENVHAYLATLGMFGTEAKKRLHEIIDFAEIEEYIDQPLRTYSTGMAARLMFSTATCVAPNMLVLDEILGVGDAYFAKKSFERMKDLCEREGTTVLLVSHDIYSAAKICERLVWFDAGRVVKDGDAKSVMNAYDNSIREQEEVRLRVKKQQKFKEIEKLSTTSMATRMILEITASSGLSQTCPVYFGKIAVSVGTGQTCCLPLGPESATEESGPHLVHEGNIWGEPTTIQGRLTRPMLNYGSPYHKVSGVVLLELGKKGNLKDIKADIEYFSEQPCELTLTGFTSDLKLDFGKLPPSSGNWVRHVATPTTMEHIARQGIVTQNGTTGIHGTANIRIDNVKILDHEGNESQILTHGKPAAFLIDYLIQNPALKERSQVIFVFYLNGSVDTCKYITRDLHFDFDTNRRGTIHLNIPKIILPDGKYSITIMIAQEGYFDRHQVVFFSINPEVHFCLGRIIEIVVKDGGLIASGSGVVADANWSISSAADNEVPVRQVAA